MQISTCFYIYPSGLNKYSKNRDHYYFSVKNEHGTLQLNNFKTTASCFLCVCKIICSNMSKVLIFDWRKVYFKSFGVNKNNPENKTILKTSCQYSWNRELVVPLENIKTCSKFLKKPQPLKQVQVTSVKIQQTEHENYSWVTEQLSEKWQEKGKELRWILNITEHREKWPSQPPFLYFLI